MVYKCVYLYQYKTVFVCVNISFILHSCFFVDDSEILRSALDDKTNFLIKKPKG